MKSARHLIHMKRIIQISIFTMASAQLPKKKLKLAKPARGGGSANLKGLQAMTKKKESISLKHLVTTEIRTKPPILVNGILPAGGGLILAGESEVGKSLMRVEMSILLAIGMPVFGMVSPGPQTILVFQQENSLVQEQFRAKQIMKGHGIDEATMPDTIHYAPRQMGTSLREKTFVKFCKDHIEETGATVVFWDPLVSYHNERENDNVRMRGVLDRITWLNRETGAASAIIHHFGQPGKKGEEIPLRYRMRGASSIRDWADTILTLRSTGTEENPGNGRVLDYIKIRNGPQRPPLHMERNRYFVHEVISEEDKRKAPLEIVLKIVKAHGKEIDSQNQLIKEVRKLTGCGRATAIRAIKECEALSYIWVELEDGIKVYRA